MQLTRIICLLLILTLVGCKSKYETKEFKYAEAPKSPDYSKLNSWAADPDKNDTIIDKFYNNENRNKKLYRGIVEVSTNSLLEEFAAKSLIS